MSSNMYPGTKPLPTVPPPKAPLPERIEYHRGASPCSDGEHNYGIVMFGEGPMLCMQDGTRIVLFVCSKCGDEHIVNLAALGLPQIKWG